MVTDSHERGNWYVEQTVIELLRKHQQLKQWVTIPAIAEMIGREEDDIRKALDTHSDSVRKTSVLVALTVSDGFAVTAVTAYMIKNKREKGKEKTL